MYPFGSGVFPYYDDICDSLCHSIYAFCISCLFIYITMYVPQFVYTFMSINSFIFRSDVNTPAMHIAYQTLCGYFHFFGKYLGMGTTGSYGNCMLIFVKNCQIIMPLYFPANNVYEEFIISTMSLMLCYYWSFKV